MEVLGGAGLVRKGDQIEEPLRGRIELHAGNQIPREGLARHRIGNRTAESGEISYALRPGRHRRILVVRTAGVIAGVVQKEKRARAGVEHVRDRQRPAERGAHSLLKVLRLRRGLSVEREGRRVETGRGDGHRHVAAHLLVAAPASARSTESTRTAEPAESAAVAATTAAGTAPPTAVATSALKPVETRRVAAATERFTHLFQSIAGSVRPKERFAALRRPKRRHRFGRRLCREPGRQQCLRHRLGHVCAVVGTRDASLIGEERETLKLLRLLPASTLRAATLSTSAAGCLGAVRDRCRRQRGTRRS